VEDLVYYICVCSAIPPAKSQNFNCNRRVGNPVGFLDWYGPCGSVYPALIAFLKPLHSQPRPPSPGGLRLANISSDAGDTGSKLLSRGSICRRSGTRRI
jgi:hypothetical protein